MPRPRQRRKLNCVDRYIYGGCTQRDRQCYVNWVLQMCSARAQPATTKLGAINSYSIDETVRSREKRDCRSSGLRVVIGYGIGEEATLRAVSLGGCGGSSGRSISRLFRRPIGRSV